MVAVNEAEVNGTFIVELKPDPLVREISKLAGAVTIILPGKPVRLFPVTENVCSAEATPNKVVNPVIAGAAESKGPLVQAIGDVELFLGTGVPVVKSVELLLVSSQPLLFLNAAVVVLNAAHALVSDSLAVP